MKKFQIEIEEILQNVFEIEAESLHEAIDIAQERYRTGEYELNENDLKETNFTEYENEIIKQKHKKDRER